MAKSSYEIQADFGRAKEQANRLDEIARNINQTADNTLGNALSGISAAWNSNSSSDYIKKGRKVQEELRKRAKELSDTASIVRRVAKNTYDAEMRAYQLARTRTY